MNIKRNCIFLLDKEKDKTDAKLRYPLPTTLRINQLQKESTKTGTKTMQVG